MVSSKLTNNRTSNRKKFKLKKTVKNKLIIFAVVTLALIIVYFPVKRKVDQLLNPSSTGTVRVDKYQDFNAVHLFHAKKNGTSPFKTNKEFKEGIGELLRDDKLVKIADNSYYRVCPLTHSHPYLTPEAEDFLNDLGKRFQKKLDENDMPEYYFQISSLLRTRENQKDLSRSNGNATAISSHMYGTTFDIPYTTVIKQTFLWNEAEVTDGKASKLLSEALGELRKEKRCVVVTERKEACFHITITN